jgi:hypothetical protein
MPRPYTVLAHPTTYAGVRFRSRLESRWAAFFDLAGWAWEYEPIELAGWAPDFLVTTPTGRLYAEVKPYLEIDDFHDHPAWSMMDGAYDPAPAVFGNSPVTTSWRTGSVLALVPAWDRLWKEAGNRTQWRAA